MASANAHVESHLKGNVPRHDKANNAPKCYRKQAKIAPADFVSDEIEAKSTASPKPARPHLTAFDRPHRQTLADLQGFRQTIRH